MIRNAFQAVTAEPDAVEPAPREEHIAPAPRVSVQAFCETVETAAAIQSAGDDRRLGKAHVKIQMGGIAAAIEARKAARAAKNFKESDRIRDELLAKGIVLKDGPTGITWEIKR